MGILDVYRDRFYIVCHALRLSLALGEIGERDSIFAGIQYAISRIILHHMCLRRDDRCRSLVRAPFPFGNELLIPEHPFLTSILPALRDLRQG